MRHKLQQALQTARELSLALSPQDEMFLVTFNSDVDMRLSSTSAAPTFPSNRIRAASRPQSRDQR